MAFDNAIFDSIAYVSEEQLQDYANSLGIKKGQMSLIDDSFARRLQTEVVPIKTAAGGSSANSLAGLQMLGAKTKFVGVTSNDDAGEKFNKSLTDLGVHVTNLSQEFDEGSGQSYILITPDGERTMLTHIGSSDNFSGNELNFEDLKETKVFFTQTYVIDEKSTMKMLQNAFKAVRKAGGYNALALSSTYMVKKHKRQINKLMTDVDILIGNSEEYAELYGISDLDDIIKISKKNKRINVITLGKDGAVIVLRNNVIYIPLFEKVNPVDTTGAGDAFAAGFLYGFTKGYSLDVCGYMGSFMANKVIKEIGARINDSSIKLYLASLY